jgi:hypothetical protein
MLKAPAPQSEEAPPNPLVFVCAFRLLPSVMGLTGVAAICNLLWLTVPLLFTHPPPPPKTPQHLAAVPALARHFCVHHREQSQRHLERFQRRGPPRCDPTLHSQTRPAQRQADLRFERVSTCSCINIASTFCQGTPPLGSLIRLTLHYPPLHSPVIQVDHHNARRVADGPNWRDYGQYDGALWHFTRRVP